MGISKDFIVSKSNKLINSKYDLSLNEQKIILILASNIQPEDKDFNKQDISIKELANILNVSSQNLYRDIPKITKNLMSKVMEFTEINEKGEDLLIQTAFLSTAKYNKSSGVVTLKFNEELKPYLLELKTLFTSYRLENALSLSSKYSIRVYEKCKQNAYKGSFVWSIEDIKEELRLTQKAYEIYNNLKRKVLDVSFTEVTNNTDLILNYEPVKEGRKVTAIEISIKERKLKKGVDSAGKLPIQGQFNIDDNIKIQELNNLYGAENVKNVMDYTNSKGSTIKNYWKYVEGALKKMQEQEEEAPAIKPASKSKSKPKELRFNNFEGRNYNYEDLEKALLGWDIEEREEAEKQGLDYAELVLRNAKKKKGNN